MEATTPGTRFCWPLEGSIDKNGTDDFLHSF